MAIPVYLAMTEWELQIADRLPAHMAWMACHFSATDSGLQDLPASLPQNSILILNDQIPINVHDPVTVAKTISQIIEENKCTGVLLDLQRQNHGQADAIIKALLKLPFPVAVSDKYAKGHTCPVFLSPPPPYITLEEYLLPWRDREIWLDTTINGTKITVTPNGTTYSQIPKPSRPLPHYCQQLNCHYRLDISDTAAVFTLCRTHEDLVRLLSDAECSGVNYVFGLYQEFSDSESICSFCQSRSPQ